MAEPSGEPLFGKFKEYPEWNWHATLVDGEVVWVFQVSGLHRAAFLPTGLLDFRPLTTVPANPPEDRVRMALVEEPPGSGSGLFRLNMIDSAGNVVLAVPSKVSELFDVLNTVLPDKGSILLGDGALPASAALWRTLTPTFPADEGKVLVARAAPAVGWALEAQSGGGGGDPEPKEHFGCMGGVDCLFAGMTTESVAVANEVQYARVRLPAISLNTVRVYLTAAGGGGANYNAALFSQTDPTEEDWTIAAGQPDTRVFELASTAVPGATGFSSTAIPGAPVVIAAGLYWVAFVTDQANPKRWLSTLNMPLAPTPYYTEAVAGVAIPATATPVAPSANLLGSVLFASVRE